MMGFFDKIFGRKKGQVNVEINSAERQSKAVVDNKYVTEVRELKRFIDYLINADKYIAKSEYIEKVKQYSETVDFFRVLESSRMLEDFCQRNRISMAEVQYILSAVDEIEKIVDRHNDDYVACAMRKNKEYLDGILKNVDPNILLDDDQRRVVLTDED